MAAPRGGRKTAAAGLIFTPAAAGRENDAVPRPVAPLAAEKLGLTTGLAAILGLAVILASLIFASADQPVAAPLERAQEASVKTIGASAPLSLHDHSTRGAPDARL